MHRLPSLSVLLLLLQAGSVLAQQTAPANPRKEHLEVCVQNLTIKVSQAEALKGVMQQPLSPAQKLMAVSEVLTPEQRQALRTCMREPMPTQPAATP